jgi:hypothetical protein
VLAKFFFSTTNYSYFVKCILISTDHETISYRVISSWTFSLHVYIHCMVLFSLTLGRERGKKEKVERGFSQSSCRSSKLLIRSLEVIRLSDVNPRRRRRWRRRKKIEKQKTRKKSRKTIMQRMMK